MDKCIYINSLSSYTPILSFSVKDAVEQGLYEEEEHINTQYKKILIEDKKFPIDMALEAALHAMKNINSKQLTKIFYSSIHRHGHKNLWSPATYLQKKLEADRAIPMSLNQGCNGQMLAIDLAISVLHAAHEEDIILSVASDRFAESSFNRWRSDYGIVYGDAATAVTLSRQKGFARILNLFSKSRAELEEMHRDVDETSESDNDQKYHYHIKDCKKAFIKKYGVDYFNYISKNTLTDIYNHIFTNVIKPEKIKYYILPNLGKKILDMAYYPIFPEAKERSLWFYGENTGHLGASDCMAGLSYLKENNLLDKGDMVFLLGAGAGFSWTAMVIEIC